MSNLKAGYNDIREKEYSRRELLKMVVPNGVFTDKRRLIIDKLKCTGCAICAQECLTGALSAQGEESIKIVFHYQICDSCGECTEICPDKCIQLESGIQEEPQVVLFEDEYARCNRCGVIIGSAAMIKKIQMKLNNSDPEITENISRCPACKGKK